MQTYFLQNIGSSIEKCGGDRNLEISGIQLTKIAQGKQKQSHCGYQCGKGDHDGGGIVIKIIQVYKGSDTPEQNHKYQASVSKSLSLRYRFSQNTHLVFMNCPYCIIVLAFWEADVYNRVVKIIQHKVDYGYKKDKGPIVSRRI